MNCAQCSEYLVSYLEKLLDDSQERAVAEHVEHCSSCRAELKGIANLHDRLNRNGQMLARDNLEDEVLTRIIREQNVRLKAAAQATASLRIRRLIMKSPIAKSAVAAVVIVAAILGVYAFLGAGSGAAFADVSRRLHNAHTLIYSVLTMTGQETAPTVRTSVIFKEPGYMRTSTADGYVTVMESTEAGVKGITLVPAMKNYITFEFATLADHAGTSPLMAAYTLRALPAQANEALGRRDIDGRRLDGYRVRNADATTTVWIDPGTGELARAELEYASSPGMNMILSDFQFDASVEDSLFVLDPPADYTPTKLKTDMADVTEEDFLAFLRMWSSWTTDRTFPPTVTGTELAQVAMQMAREGKFGASPGAGGDHGQEAQIMYRGMVFMGKFPSDAWRYAGQNVPYGDPQTPIFWYRPAGSATYRVIYADLHVANVAPENLPK